MASILAKIRFAPPLLSKRFAFSKVAELNRCRTVLQSAQMSRTFSSLLTQGASSTPTSKYLTASALQGTVSMSSINQDVAAEEKFEMKPSWTAPVKDEYLLRKKYDLLFLTYDINQDGLFSWDDAEEYIMRLEQIRGDAVADMPHFREMIRKFLGDMIGDPNRGIDRWQFVDSLCNMRNKNAKRMTERLSKKAVILWECMDLDGDGDVQGEEFVLMFQAMMIDNNSVAKQIFKMIDVNNDGTISKSELRELYLNYMMNERPDPLSVIYLSGRKSTQRRP